MNLRPIRASHQFVFLAANRDIAKSLDNALFVDNLWCFTAYTQSYPQNLWVISRCREMI